MRILITGAKGQLGRDCSQVLGSAGWTVFGRGSRELDIADAAGVDRCLAETRPDAVVNCAAYTAVDGCETHRRQCRRVNTEGAGIVAEVCARHGCRLLHISTDYVFDGRRPAPQPYLESDSPAPVSEYGASKLAGEELIREKLDNHLIIRTSWLYGIGGGNFLKTMLRLAVTNPGRTIRVVNDQFGSLTWTHRLAHQIQELLGSSLAGTVHATAEGCGTWYEGARFFLECMAVRCSIEPCSTADYPTPARRPANSILDNSVLKTHGLNHMADWRHDVRTFAGTFREELLREAYQKSVDRGRRTEDRKE